MPQRRNYPFYQIVLMCALALPVRRIGKSIHFPQVADLRWRNYNRGHEVAESYRKVVSSATDCRF